MFRQKHSRPSQYNKDNIKNEVLRPAKFFEHAPAGAGDEIGKIKDDIDIGREHDHKGKGGIKSYGSKPW
jgi:hypothetical protein